MPVWIDIPDKVVWFMEALNSIRTQSFQDWEVIIIDDHSSYELSEPKWNYQDEPRFRWFKTAHTQGPSLCRNTAAGLAESDALLPLDADDMLGHENVLSDMYAAWEQDKSRIIYGDLQRLVIKGTSFERGKKFVLGQYAFDEAMKLGGIMPVTTLHSRACHEKSGGWKPELEAGLEDVEYIIAAGKAGFCGHKISSMVLLYRQHNESRAYKLRHGDGSNVPPREGEMRSKIIELHADIYRGEFPVGCCGQTSNTTNYAQSGAMVKSGIVTTLDQYSKEEKIWVEYIGSKGAGFSVIGTKTRANYHINGKGHKFEAHRDDINIFRGMDRGTSFLVGISNPNSQPEPTSEPEPVNQNAFNPPAPELAVIERLDKIAAKSRGLDLPEAPLQESITMQPTVPVAEQVGLQPPIVPQPVVSEQIGLQPSVNPLATTKVSIADLDLGNIGNILRIEGWTVEQLANASLDGPDGLLAIHGVGPTRANQAIDKAKKLLETA